MRSLLSFALVSAAFVLTGCNGTVSSVSFPSEAPWERLRTGILSPTGDLVAVSTGAGLEAELLEGNPLGIQALVLCKEGDSTYLGTCGDRACDPQAVCGTGTPLEKRYAYTLVADLDRGVFKAGGVQLLDGSGATRMGISVNASESFDVAAGFSEGLVPGYNGIFQEESAILMMSPHWPDFGSGGLAGELCDGEGCRLTTIATCSTREGEGDFLGYITATQPGTYSGTCGSVPVSLTINPPYSNAGECLRQRKAACGGLQGQDRSDCEHAQTGVCHATFNVPSAHNPS